MRLVWTAENIEKAKRLYVEEGKSAAETARSIPGATRNSVIGKAHRMGWTQTHRQKPTAPARAPAAGRTHARPPRPGPQNRPGAVFGKVSVDNPAETERKRAAAKAESDALIAAMSGPANDDAIPLIDRGRFQCSFPVGTPERPAEQMCCGQRVAFDAGRAVPTYCAGHARIALNARQPVRKIPSEPSQRRAA